MNDGDFDPAVGPDEGYDIAQLAGLIIVALGLLGIVCPSAAEYTTAMFPLYLACCSPWEVGRPDDRIVGLPKLLEYITRVKEADCAYRWHVQNCKCPLTILFICPRRFANREPRTCFQTITRSARGW